MYSWFRLCLIPGRSPFRSSCCHLASPLTSARYRILPCRAIMSSHLESPRRRLTSAFNSASIFGEGFQFEGFLLRSISWINLVRVFFQFWLWFCLGFVFILRLNLIRVLFFFCDFNLIRILFVLWLQFNLEFFIFILGVTSISFRVHECGIGIM